MNPLGKWLGALLCLAAGGSLSRAADPADTNAAAPFPPSQILRTWGWMLAHQKKVAGVELTTAERQTFLQGFTAGVANQPPPANLQRSYFDVQQLAKARNEKVVQAIMRQNEAGAAAFVATLQTNSRVRRLPDAVWCEIQQPGAGAPPRTGQTVNVHYTARLLDGTEFSQAGPLDMVLVTNRAVCRGWVSAVQQLGVGGALKLYVPPPLGEDEAESFGIQPGSLMVFDLELLGVTNTTPEDLANATLPPAPAPQPPPPSGCPPAQIMETWGWTIAKESRADKFGLDQNEVTWLRDGLAAGMQAQPAPASLTAISTAVEQYVAAQRAKVRRQFEQKQAAESEALFAGLETNASVVALPDGLRYEIIQPGTGAFPQSNQTVTVRYTGRLINGTVFDRTEIGPLDIDLDKVIRGWSEGVQKINVGGKIKLYIPPSLGYREVATSGIPAHSTLIYEVELLAIKSGDH